MDDLWKKAIKGLECCLNTGGFEECTESCPYFTKELGVSVCSENMKHDALSLLKTQEPVSPKVDIDTYVCGACGTRLERQSLIGPNAVLAETFNYCPECGQKVKWE